jgi:outer membrane murein-binding lipoprotein Lpp
MNDRELLEYIAAQVGNLTKDVAEVNADIKYLKEDVGSIKNQIAKIEVEHGKKLDALFDGYKQNTESIKELSSKVDNISDKVDHHDIKIQVIEGGKRA